MTWIVLDIENSERNNQEIKIMHFFWKKDLQNHQIILNDEVLGGGRGEETQIQWPVKTSGQGTGEGGVCSW